MIRAWAALVGFATLLLTPQMAFAQSCSRLETVRAELERDFFEQERLWSGFVRSHELYGCDHQVADLLAAFRSDHAIQIADDGRSAFAGRNRFKLLVNEARYAARDGQYERAITLLELAKAENPETWGTTLISFIDVELAFLRRDRAGLESARDHVRADVMALPRDDALRRLAGQLLLNQVDGFIRCFDRTYLDADTNACHSMARAR